MVNDERVKKVKRAERELTDNSQQTLNLIHSRRLILLHPEVTLATSGRSNCYIATNQKLGGIQLFPKSRFLLSLGG